MGKRVEQVLCKRRSINGQKEYEKMLNIIREMQIKTTIIYHYITTRMAKVFLIDSIVYCQGYRATGTLTVC